MTEPTEPTQPAASRKTTGIRLEGVAKRFRGGVEAVRALDLDFVGLHDFHGARLVAFA